MRRKVYRRTKPQRIVFSGVTDSDRLDHAYEVAEKAFPDADGFTAKTGNKNKRNGVKDLILLPTYPTKHGDHS